MNAIEQTLGDLRRQSFSDVRKACASDEMRRLLGDGALLQGVSEAIDTILNEVLSHRTLAGLASIRSADTRLFEHGIDVCVTAIMLGRAVNIPERRLKPLAVGALLHDIGHVFLDPHGDNDPARRVRQHTLLGYELLKHGDNPDILAPHVALEHHEHQDGTGEPRGVYGSNKIERDRSKPPPIPTLLGEVVAVANTYDILASGLWGQAPLPPDQALAAVAGLGGTHLNKTITAAFLRTIPVYPKGVEVVVRSGEYRNFSGVVADVRPEQLDRPVVVLTRNSGNDPMPPVELDLSDAPEATIRVKTF
jgi:HD-GYP domain-containing protein (c-di-GMP phosphodiesterase class II)